MCWSNSAAFSFSMVVSVPASLPPQWRVPGNWFYSCCSTSLCRCQNYYYPTLMFPTVYALPIRIWCSQPPILAVCPCPGTVAWEKEVSGETGIVYVWNNWTVRGSFWHCCLLYTTRILANPSSSSKPQASPSHINRDRESAQANDAWSELWSGGEGNDR